MKENILVISYDLIFCRRNNLAISPLKNKDKVHKETQQSTRELEVIIGKSYDPWSLVNDYVNLLEN